MYNIFEHIENIHSSLKQLLFIMTETLPCFDKISSTVNKL